MSPAEDPVRDALREMAAARFATAFLPDLEMARILRRPWVAGDGLELRPLPAHAAFQEALCDDLDLSAFAPPGEPFVLASTGTGWLVQEGQLGPSLVASATVLHVARGKALDDLDGFLEEIDENLEAFRRLVRGEEVVGITVVAFDGLTLDGGAVLETAWGPLRAASELERGLAPWELTPTAILLVETPLTITLNPDLENPPREAPRGRPAVVARAKKLLPLAALLGVSREEYLVPGCVWTSTVIPAQLGIGYEGFSVSRARSLLPPPVRTRQPARGGDGPQQGGRRLACRLDGHRRPALRRDDRCGRVSRHEGPSGAI